jgi:uncharacterized protein (TIGR02001 family)
MASILSNWETIVMRKTLIAVSLAAAFGTPAVVSAQTAAPAAAPSDHTFAGNAGLFSEYRFRGISQTFAKPAFQGGIDYSHSSGIYLGNWNSNVSSGAGFPSGNLEMDFYGGWKKSWGDFGLDIGYIYYYYPGSNANAAAGTTFVNPKNATKTFNGTVDNKEIYIGGSWKWISAKYYYSVGDYFSLPDTKGSNYLDITANYDLGGGWGLVGHVGSFRLKNWHTGTDATKGNYTDWKVGVTKDIGGWVFGAAYLDTNAKGSCNPANQGFYCFGNSTPGGTTAVPAGTKFKDAGKGVVLLSVSKTF